MSGNDPAPGIEANAGSTIFQPMPFPRPGVAAYRFNRGPERAAQIARGISAGDNHPPVLARWMQEAFSVLRGTRGGPTNYLYSLPWYVLIGLTPTRGAAVSFAPAGSPPVVIEESGVGSLYRLAGAGCANSGGTEAPFSIGGRNLRYHFPSSAGRKLLDSVRPCPGGA